MAKDGMSSTTDHEAILALTCELIAQQSVTPDDAECQAIISNRLAKLGFSLEQIDMHGVRNLWASRGSGQPHLMFAGHTDVVPPGPLDQWHTPPFAPTVVAGKLYGRGAADMKASLAAMLVAVEKVLTEQPDLPGTLSFLITSDEEGDAIYGTNAVINTLRQRGIKPDYCIVGEPSSSQQVGDVVRCGRRGSLNGKLHVYGVQGHVAYPDDADNPIHHALGALAELSEVVWDDGNEYYPPTSFQISNINAGTGAHNVVPAHAEVLFNLRYSTEIDAQQIMRTTAAILDKHELDYAIDWKISGYPFLTAEGELVAAAQSAIRQHTGITTSLETTGGTSDGRFIAPTGAQVLELGPVNESIHKLNEHVNVDELEQLSQIYQSILDNLLT